MNVHSKIEMKQAFRMWRDGSSIGDIAGYFGVSRGQVAGMMNRNREKFPKKTEGEMDFRSKDYVPISRKGRTAKARMDAVAKDVQEFADGTSAYLRPALTDQQRLATAKSQLDLGDKECKWPVNSGGPFLFCAEATDGGPWCSHHKRRAFAS